MELPDIKNDFVKVTLGGVEFEARKLTIGDMMDFAQHQDVLKLLVASLKPNYPEVTEEYVRTLNINSTDELTEVLRKIGLNNDSKKAESPVVDQAGQTGTK